MYGAYGFTAFARQSELGCAVPPSAPQKHMCGRSCAQMPCTVVSSAQPAPASQPTCTWGGQPDFAAATNFQDMWWNAPAGSEPGWGINFAHQGETIFAKYDPGSSLFAIASGSVHVRLDPSDPSKVVPIATGSIFGEVGLISGRKRGATIVAAEDAICVEISRNAALKLQSQVPSARRAIERISIERLLLQMFGSGLTAADVVDVVDGARIMQVKAGEAMKGTSIDAITRSDCQSRQANVASYVVPRSNCGTGSSLVAWVEPSIKPTSNRLCERPRGTPQAENCARPGHHGFRAHVPLLSPPR